MEVETFKNFYPNDPEPTMLELDSMRNVAFNHFRDVHYMLMIRTYAEEFKYVLGEEPTSNVTFEYMKLISRLVLCDLQVTESAVRNGLNIAMAVAAAQ